jgi:hypothetical protein
MGSRVESVYNFERAGTSHDAIQRGFPISTQIIFLKMFKPVFYMQVLMGTRESMDSLSLGQRMASEEV